MNRKEIISYILTAIMTVIWLITFKKCSNDNTKFSEAINDTLVKKKNKDGSQTAKIALLSSINTDLILELQTKDSTIKFLQEQVRINKKKLKEGGSVTVISSETTFTDVSTTSITSVQPVKDSTGVKFYPVYEASNTDTTWTKWKVKASKDSTKVSFVNKDRYSILIGREKIGFIKYKPIVEVTTFNPNNNIKSMRAFEVKDTRNDRITIGAQAGFGITMKGFGPYIGVGANFKLFGL